MPTSYLERAVMNQQMTHLSGARDLERRRRRVMTALFCLGFLGLLLLIST
jgi:hypothetical protein